MKFSTRVDVDAAIEDAFTVTTDFERLERKIRRNGIRLVRLTNFEPPSEGSTWRADFKYRGKARQVTAELIEIQAPESLKLQGAGASGLDIDCNVSFIKLSASKCRMKVGLELRPKTIPARLLIQSMKFAKGSLDKRFAERVTGFAKDIAQRCQ